MDLIKEAFSKIKEDMLSLRNEVSDLKIQINEIKTIQTHSQISTTQQTDKQTNNTPFNPNFIHNIESSIGNRGVPTDKQTNKQTDKQTNKQTDKQTQNYINPPINKLSKNPISEFKRANEILTSLDNIKKGIRSKFKNLTPQEMLVFSTLYALEGQKIEHITYQTLAKQLSLSESSIRDYVNKLIKKGVPINKIRQNNKTILLKISQDLKNVATLDTIINLRAL